MLAAPVAAALRVLARINQADAATRAAFQRDPLAHLAGAIEAAGGDGGMICALRGYGPRVVGVGPWVLPVLSFPLPVARDWFPAEEFEVLTISLPDGPLLLRREEVGVLREQIAQALASGLHARQFQGRSLPLTPALIETVQQLAGRLETESQAREPAAPATRTAVLTRDNEERLTWLASRRATLGCPPLGLSTALYDLIRRRYGLPAPQPEIINGTTAAAARDRIRRAFQARRGFDCLLLGPRAAGLGLTLTAANHVIHLNRWWNPAVEDQASDRVYRIGQTRPVTIWLPQAIHPVLGAASFDSLLHGLLEEKRALSRAVVVPVQFSDGDLRRLLAGSLGAGRDADDPLTHIDNLDGRAFEAWVAGALQTAGFVVELTPGSGDGGVDVIATPTGGRAVFVQCKHRAQAGSVGDEAVADLLRARTSHQGRWPDPRLVAVTNGRFTLAATNLALEHQVQLVDRDRLAGLGATLRA